MDGQVTQESESFKRDSCGVRISISNRRLIKLHKMIRRFELLHIDYLSLEIKWRYFVSIDRLFFDRYFARNFIAYQFLSSWIVIKNSWNSSRLELFFSINTVEATILLIIDRNFLAYQAKTNEFPSSELFEK